MKEEHRAVPVTRRRNMESGAYVKILRVLLIFFVFLLDDVTSDIDGRGFFEWNRLGKAKDLDEIAEKLLTDCENSDWKSPRHVGQISGVSVDPSGNPVIFHRGDRIWRYDTFTEDNVYREEYKGTIQVDTVLMLDSKTGDVIRSWGNQTFYLPHGIHIDGLGNVWLTDVALHQVFKYDSYGVPLLVLGKRFEPGNDMEHFCKPTSVAVAPTGEIVVADGYCNSRLVLFDSLGNPRNVIQEGLNLRIPHSLTILPDRKVCVADRENQRVLCLNVGLPGSGPIFSEAPYSIPTSGRVFAIASHRSDIYGVNVMTLRYEQSFGFTINLCTRSIDDVWSPECGSFRYPHDIAISPNGTVLYVTDIGPNIVWKLHLSERRDCLQNIRG